MAIWQGCGYEGVACRRHFQGCVTGHCVLSLRQEVQNAHGERRIDRKHCLSLSHGSRTSTRDPDSNERYSGGLERGS
eukprot:172344-Karenia_brevis.AAC.1